MGVDVGKEVTTASLRSAYGSAPGDGSPLGQLNIEVDQNSPALVFSDLEGIGAHGEQTQRHAAFASVGPVAAAVLRRGSITAGSVHILTQVP